MPANVVEGPKLSGCIPANKKRFTRNLDREVIAGLLNLAAMPHYLPGARKDLVLLPREHLRIEIEARRQRPRAGHVRIDVNPFRVRIHTDTDCTQSEQIGISTRFGLRS